LVGTYMTGLVDKNFLAYLGGWPKALHDVYGVEFQETTTLYPKQHNHVAAFDKTYTVNDYADTVTVDTAQSLATYQDDFFAGSSALTKNICGKGTAYYVAARTEENFLEDFYDQLTDEFSLKPDLPIEKQGPTVSIQVREKAGQQFFFVINFSEKPATVTTTKSLTEVLSGQNVAAGAQALKPFDVKVYTG